MFGIGASSSRSNSSSQSEELSLGLDVAESFGQSGSTDRSTSSGQSSSSESIAFEELYRSLYGDAKTAAAGIDAPEISKAAKQLFSGGLGFLERLNGNAGTDALKARIGDTSARDSQLEALRSQLGDFFNEDLLPGVTSRGVATGTLGGDRDAVEIERAAKAVSGQFATGAASIIGQDQTQRDNAAMSLAGLDQQGALGGLNALSSLFGLAEGGELAKFAPMQLLAQVLGGPTVLGESQSTDIAQALSDSFSEDGSQSYGFDFGTATSSSQSRSKSKSLSIGAQGS